MRFFSLLAAFTLLAGCTATKKSAVLQQLEGTWLPLRQEIGGNALPAAAFEKQRLILHDSSYTVVAESVDKGVVHINGSRMDIYGKEGVNAGRHFTALYRLEQGQLTICYNLSGTTYPESFDTKGKPLYFLSVYKK